MLIAPSPAKRGSGLKLKVDWKRALGVKRLQLPRRRSRLERELIERLRKLGLVRRPFSIERISGGLSNHNFAVRTGGQSYFVRICQELPLLGIDRRNEMVCHQAASLRGLAPEIIHHERGLLITRFIEGRTLDPIAVRDPAMLPRLAAAAWPPARRLGPRDGRGSLFLRVPDRAHLRTHRGPAPGLTSARHRSNSRRHHRAFAASRPVSARPLP